MELYHEILADYYAEHGYLDQMLDGTAVVRDMCYQAICQIKAVLEDDTMDDPECFARIERIVCVLEEMGLDADMRHDFG